MNSAILDYLMKYNYSGAAQAFQEEAGVQPPDGAVSSIKKDLLEKKWTSIVKLKKQVMELEK